jgi:3',5'-cyclic AMP phosphodiesterase CpdA
MAINVLTRRNFLQMAMATMATLAINPSSALAAIPLGKYTKNIKFTVLSDPHYYYPQLGTTGAAFAAYLAGDRKMLAESETTLRSALNAIKLSDAQFVLICGDLTKDGEYIGHQRFATYLSELTSMGKKVFVIPGNHDIYNPHAYSYSGSTQTRVPNTSPSVFKNLYQAFGYGQAIAQDPNSLSYVVEPADNLRLIAMDSCIYGTNYTSPPTGGAFSADRLNWIKAQITAATAKGKTVIGMMHHGIVPHFSAQPTYFSEYVVANYNQVAQDFSSLGMNVVFTGHFHAQDIAEKIANINNNYLVDIETGSLVTYPIPYRQIELTPDYKKIKIASTKVTSTTYNTGGLDFQTYAKNFTAQNMKELFVEQFTGVIMQLNPGLTQAQAQTQAASLAVKQIAPSLTISDLFANAMLAHYQGDEKMDAQTQGIYQAMASAADPNSKVLGQFLLSVGTDTYLPDNTVTIDLTTGKPIMTLLNAM